MGQRASRIRNGCDVSLTALTTGPIRVNNRGVSISIILVPLAVAAATKAASMRSGAGNACTVSTRMRDPNLLRTALSDTGARTTLQSPDSIDAEWEGLAAQLRRDPDGVWSAHFTGTRDAARCTEVVQAIDRAYGLRVQEEVIAKLKDRAPAAGMTLLSETANSDASVTMVLEVRGDR